MSFIQKSEAYYEHKKVVSRHSSHRKQYDEFIFDADDLSYLMSHFQEPHLAISLLAQMGGVEGITYALNADMASGLNEDTLELRRNVFGSNEEATKPPIPFLVLCYQEAKDPMLRILLIAALISIVTGAIQHPLDGWIDGLAILLAVVIVVAVGGFNNYQKEKQFRIQEAESKKKFCIVMRNGEEKKIPFGEVVVGDLVILRTGFQIPGDGIFVLGTDTLKSQEAGLTGESKELHKGRFHPLLMKGTNIVSGEGLMIVLSVGEKTEWGQLMSKLSDERDKTPLQDRLSVLGGQIGIGGIIVAVVLFVVLVIVWSIKDRTDWLQQILLFFIMAVTVVVVAVPEGLPLAVAISLAYSMKKMLIDNNFVRHLQACEVMGNATTICSDKTGTLTTNKMSVGKCHLFGNKGYLKVLVKRDEITFNAFNRISVGICVNTKSFEDKPKTEMEKKAIAEGKLKMSLIGGNQTDSAMLQWIIDLGATNYAQIRHQNPVIRFFPFDSKVKRSAVLLRDHRSNKNKYVLYVKGAAEQILNLCRYVMDENDEFQEKTQKVDEDILHAMDVMTGTGLRCLGMCYRLYSQQEIDINTKESEEWFNDMIWIGVVGIADPVRTEVPESVETCQKAGIVVRMVTGDHLETAKHIAKQCGILTCSDHVCMTGNEFRALSTADKDKLLPRLRVLARSKPADKEELVRWYKTSNQPRDIVAVTGDGANDALALKNADVGLAMGIQGTDVAKEASDIIILDDNFASIEKTVMWGRSVYDNIRKFLQFQLTVNVTALTVSLIGAFYPPWQNPLTPVQLLWINLIMDTMAALALATEQPTRKLLNRHPFKKDAHIINQVLWRFIFGHSVYQLIVLMLTLIFGKQWLGIDDSTVDKHQRNWHHLTVVFNVFVWMQIFNEVNARKVNNERNVFVGIHRNIIFWVIIIISVIAQVLLVQFFGEFAQTVKLTLKDWGYCMVWGAATLLWHQVVVSIPVNLNQGIQIVDSETLFKREDEFSPGCELKIDNNVTESTEIDSLLGEMN